MLRWLFDWLFHRRRLCSVFILAHQGPRLMTSPITINVGHSAALSISYLDQNGAALPAPVPDKPPVWTNVALTTATLAVSADGQTATEAAIAPGTDTVNLSVVVGGKTFTTSLGVTVQPAPPVLTSIQINAVVS